MPSRFQKQLSPGTSPAAICEGVCGDNVMRRVSEPTLKKAQQKLAESYGTGNKTQYFHMDSTTPAYGPVSNVEAPPGTFVHASNAGTGTVV